MRKTDFQKAGKSHYYSAATRLAFSGRNAPRDTYKTLSVYKQRPF